MTMQLSRGTPEEHFAWACGEMLGRILSDSPMIRQMIQVNAYYTGDYVVPIPNSDDLPDLPRTTPMLMAEAIDSAGRSAGSVMFDVNLPIVSRPGWKREDSRRNVAHRRAIIHHTHDVSGFSMLRRRAFRQYAGYATYGFDVVPDLKIGGPRIRLLDPLLCYPDPRSPEDPSPPENLGQVRAFSAAWLRARYPQACAENGGPINAKALDDLWDVLEWTDAEVCMIGILGPRDGKAESYAYVGTGGGSPSLLLSWYPNLLGRCNAVMPRRVSLSTVATQMAQLTGVIELMDRINALDIVASERAVFPDVYVTGDGNRPPRLVGGEWEDGRTGKVNLLEGATGVGTLRAQPDPNAKMTVDRMERNFRIGTGLVPQIGGETYGALRTGRGIDSLLAAAVDPRIQEIHEIDAYYQGELCSMILGTYKEWWTRSKIEIFPGYRTDAELLEIEPGKVVVSTMARASYAIPGADVSQTTITLGQLLGIKGISLRSFRRMHPWIDDPEGEGNMLDEEALEEFVLQAIFGQVQSGQLPLTYVAKLEKHRKNELDIFLAIEKADLELREEQAQLEAEAQQMAPGTPAPPEMQPGLGPAPPVEQAPVVNPQVADRVGQANQLLSALQAGA